jgi:Family of unknown function (DUF5317)
VSFLGLVVLAAALVPLLTRGSYRRLAEVPWRWAGLLAAGLGLQLLLDTSLVPRSSWHSVGFGILVASYVLLIGFCAGNILVRGMAVVLIGVALNGFVVTIDQGMPVRIPPDWQRGQNHVTATVKHHPREAGDHLLVLTDIITLRRLDAVISFGDLIIAFGLVDATFWASRRARRSRAAAREHDRAPLADGPNADDFDEVPVGAGPSLGSDGRGNGARPPRERESVGAGRGRGRSGSAHPTVAIQDALERLERS